jgi:hypothetical protein
MSGKTPFWLNKSFEEMTEAEWESLCDHCGKCCLHKLEDEDTGDVYYTKVVCRAYDLNGGYCGVYEQRQQHVPECLVIDRKNISQYGWLPKTCAYRLLAEGKPLRAWHPLISGTHESIIKAKIAVKGKVLHESQVDADDLEDYVISWVK